LAPAVLQRQDLIAWPLLFFVGFIFFAAFIEKFSELVQTPFRHHATSLAERLRHKGMVYGESFDDAQDEASQSASADWVSTAVKKSSFADGVESGDSEESRQPVHEQSGPTLVKAKTLANGAVFHSESVNSDHEVVSLECGSSVRP
jgi:hypothetical protein